MNIDFNNNPLLSVVIPVYNVERYLDECILSVLNQSYQNLEVILVDDGSTDSSSMICDRYASEDNRVRVIHKKNQGSGMARNSGLDMVSGELVTFIDSDDCIDVDAYSSLIPQVLNNNLDFIQFDFTFFSDNNPINPQKERLGHVRMVTDKEIMREMSTMLFEQFPLSSEQNLRFEGSVCGGIYRMKVLKQYTLRFFSEREFLSEDYLFMFELLQCVSRIGFSSDSFYNYRFVQGSISKAPRIDRVMKAHSYCLYLKDRMITCGYTEEDTKHLMGYFSGNLIDSFINICHLKSSFSMKRKMISKIISTEYCREVLRVYDARHRLKSWRLFFFLSMKYHFWGVYLLYKHLR